MKADIVPLLLLACPKALTDWQESIFHQWAEGQEDGNFLETWFFASHIVHDYEQGQTSYFPAFFATVERLLVEGDEQVIELMSIGLLEDIQNIAADKPYGYLVFEQWLGPISHVQWAEAELFYKRNHPEVSKDGDGLV